MRGLKRNKTLVATAAFRGAGGQRQTQRRIILSTAPEARTESALEVIDEVLIRSPALGRLTRHARLAVARRANVIEFQTGQPLCHMGGSQDCILVIMSGQVEVVEGTANNTPLGRCDSGAAAPPSAQQHLDSRDRAAPNRQHHGTNLHPHPHAHAHTGSQYIPGAHAHPALNSSSRADARLSMVVPIAGMQESCSTRRPEDVDLLLRGASVGAVDLGWLAALPREASAGHPTDLAAVGSELEHDLPCGSGMPDNAAAAGSVVGGYGSWDGAVAAHAPAEQQRVPQSSLPSQSSFSSACRGGPVLPGLRWPCTAVAVERVACVSISLELLRNVMDSNSAWDVEALVDCLEALPMFAPLSREELSQLARLLRSQVMPGGTVLYKQGSYGNDLFIIRSGYVRLLKQVALDDAQRSRLNRMSTELVAHREQAVACAAAIHGNGGLASRGSTPRMGQGRIFPPALPMKGNGQTAARLSTPRNELAGTQHKSGALTHRERTPAVATSPHQQQGRPSTSLGHFRARPPRTPPRAALGPWDAAVRSGGGQGEGPAAGLAGSSRANSLLRLDATPPRTPSSDRAPLAHSTRAYIQSGEQQRDHPGGLSSGVALGAWTSTSDKQLQHQEGSRPAQHIEPTGLSRRGRRSSSNACGEELRDAVELGPRMPLEAPDEAIIPAEVSTSGSEDVGGSGTAPLGGGIPPHVPRLRLGEQPLQQSQSEVVFVELGTLGSGQCFGEVRVDGAAVRSSSAVCDTRTELLVVSRTEVYNRLGAGVFGYLWGQIPTEGGPPALDPAVAAGQCTHQLERSMKWALYKKKLVADVLSRKEERRRTELAVLCR